MPRDHNGEAESVSRVEPEVFLSSHRRISDWCLKAEELKASGKAAVNTAKALGINLDAYKLVRKLAKLERPRAEAMLRDTLLYAKWLDLGLGDQLDLFGQDDRAMAGLTAKVVNEHKGWETERAGYDAGKAGEPSDNCQHLPGSELHQRWMVGWHDGNAYRQQAEARGEQIIKPKRGGSNPEDGDEVSD